MSNSGLDNALVGAAGVYYVASELSLRGLIALPTVRNTAGTDILVTARDGTWHANLQVKTTYKRKQKHWNLNKRYYDFRGKRSFYVFLTYIRREGRFEAFLQGADRVATEVSQTRRYHKRRGLKDLPQWFIEDHERQKLRQKWANFGRKYAVSANS